MHYTYIYTANLKGLIITCSENNRLKFGKYVCHSQFEYFSPTLIEFPQITSIISNFWKCDFKKRNEIAYPKPLFSHAYYRYD